MRIHHKLLLLALIPMAFYLYSSVISFLSISSNARMTEGMIRNNHLLAQTSVLLSLVQNERAAVAAQALKLPSLRPLQEVCAATDQALVAFSGLDKGGIDELRARLAKARNVQRTPEALDKALDDYAPVVERIFSVYNPAANAPSTKGIGKVFMSLSLLELAQEHAARLQILLSGAAATNLPQPAALRQTIIRSKEMVDSSLESPALIFSTEKQRLTLAQFSKLPSWQAIRQAYATVIDRGASGQYGLQPAQLDQAGREYAQAIAAFADAEQAEITRKLVGMERDEKYARYFDIGFFIVSLLAVVIATWLLARNIGHSLHKATLVAQAVSRGDFTQRADISSRDELGALAGALNGMTGNLQRTAELAREIAGGDLTREVELAGEQDVLGLALREMVQGLRGMVGELNDTGSQIKNSAILVFESSDQLSQGATRSAASLEEVTASITQIGSQGKHNAENAMQASQLAAASRDAAERGSARMSEMTAAMQEIIASSQHISKIIKTIDDIAFQTNLLALNAAVEAARAGSHGKGFAVVAQEVRNLAARSAKAARETAELIESSNRKVGNGSQIAGHTAQVFGEIVASIKKVADLAEDIASSSNEQAQGVAQVSIGLNQISEVTQQNTASAEQTATAAEELSQLSLLLQKLLQRFDIGATAGHAFAGDSRHEQPVLAVAESPWGGAVRALPAPADDCEALIPWSERFSVGSHLMDEQHKVLVGIINKLYAALRSGKANNVQEDILTELLDYTRTHFGREEAALRLVKFPGLAQQEKLHRSFEAKVAEFQKRLEAGHSLGVETMTFLKDWLLNHIQKVDKQYESSIGDHR